MTDTSLLPLGRTIAEIDMNEPGPLAGLHWVYMEDAIGPLIRGEELLLWVHDDPIFVMVGLVVSGLEYPPGGQPRVAVAPNLSSVRNLAPLEEGGANDPDLALAAVMELVGRD